MKISSDVANILGNSKTEGNILFLPEGQLDRKLYVAVNKVLTSIGGKWNRKEKGHIFSNSPEEVVEEILLTGEYTDKKKEYQFFETPKAVVNQLLELADRKFGETVLEPSAGQGAIADVILNDFDDSKGWIKCDCVELMEENRNILIEKGYKIVGKDFLTFNKRYDVIIANPPFTRQQDIDHVNHMLDLADRKVVSVMSSSVLFRTNKKTVQFRERVESLGGEFIKLDDNSFAESGTKVSTCIVNITL